MVATFPFRRLHRFLSTFALLAAVMLASQASAQTAPQLLPYTTKLIAGGGSTAAKAGSACSRAGATPSGNTSTDAYGDGCLATEITLATPRDAVTDRTGAVFFADYKNGLIRRIDPVTGIVTLVAGGATASPSGTVAAPVACGGTDPNTSTDTLGDGCLATSVKLGNPAFVTFSPAGDLYFSDPYNYDVRKIAAVNGMITSGSVISLVIGNYAGTNANADGYRIPCSVTDTSTATGCLLRSPYGIVFDNQGDLLIAEEYYEALIAVNTNATGSTTVAGQSVPAGTAAKVGGSGSSGGTCVMGPASTKSDGCTYGTYTSGSQASASYLDAPYGIALDPTNNIFFTDEYYNNVAEVTSPAGGVLSSYAGAYPLNAVGSKTAATTRAPAGSFAIGSDFGIAVDLSTNVYVTDALNGYIWRVDNAGKEMYVVAGGGAAATTAGSPCPNNPNFTATDTLGDGCPGLVATFSKSSNTCTATSCYASSGGIFGVSVDGYENLFVGDENNNVIREVSSGTQFGAIGATQTDYIDIHFAAGDGPLKSGGFAVTGPFILGTPTSSINSDNTTDYIVPVTADPSASGAFSGVLSVYSNQAPLGTPFLLSGTYVQSPITRTVLSTSSSLNCGAGATYPTTTAVTLTANLIANGPSAPTGTITFTANGTQLGTPQTVTNLGTATAPSYGATLMNTFATAGLYVVTATYTPTGSYFTGSTSAPVNLTSTTPTFTAANTGYQEASVTAGGTALYSFTVTQTAYTGTISFACSNLPTNSSCSFSPQSITANGCSAGSLIAMSIQTQQAVTPLPGSMVPGGRWTLFTAFGGVGMMLLFSMRRRGSMLRFGRLGLLCGLLLALTGITGCGKGTQGTAATPSGTKTITVTATGSTGVTSSFTVQLTVQ